MSRLKIGIPGWSMGANSFGATVPYLHFFDTYGEVHILPPTKEIFDHIDFIVMPGGKDTAPQRYGEIPSYHNSDPDQYKEFFLDTNLKGYIDKGVPIFGICLGFQMLNVFFGGSLTQNVYHPYSEKCRGELVHGVNFTPKFKKLELELGYNKKKDGMEVNSLHHQGVSLENLSGELDPIVIADDDVVEAFIHKNLPIAGVQYHCEEIFDRLSAHLISELIDKLV